MARRHALSLLFCATFTCGCKTSSPGSEVSDAPAADPAIARLRTAFAGAQAPSEEDLRLGRLWRCQSTMAFGVGDGPGKPDVATEVVNQFAEAPSGAGYQLSVQTMSGRMSATYDVFFALGSHELVGEPVREMRGTDAEFEAYRVTQGKLLVEVSRAGRENAVTRSVAPISSYARKKGATWAVAYKECPQN